MREGLSKFIKDQGYSSITDFRGILIDKPALTFSEITVSDAVARIASEKCNGCGLCIKPAHCGLDRRAINIADNKAVIEEAQCVGCETCASICPCGAVTMVLKK